MTQKLTQEDFADAAADLFPVLNAEQVEALFDDVDVEKDYAVAFDDMNAYWPKLLEELHALKKHKRKQRAREELVEKLERDRRKLTPEYRTLVREGALFLLFCLFFLLSTFLRQSIFRQYVMSSGARQLFVFREFPTQAFGQPTASIGTNFRSIGNRSQYYEVRPLRQHQPLPRSRSRRAQWADSVLGPQLAEFLNTPSLLNSTHVASNLRVVAYGDPLSNARCGPAFAACRRAAHLTHGERRPQHPRRQQVLVAVRPLRHVPHPRRSVGGKSDGS